MVTLTKYGAKYNRNILFLEGLSTDTKPTDEFDGLSIQNGSEYTEVDTGKKFLYDYDNATWYEVQTGGGGGGGGGGTSNYNDLSNRPSVNNTVLTGNKTSAQLGLASSEQGGKADSAIQGVKLNSGSIITPDANKVVDVTVGKADVGLGNVDNTSDLNKPISTATQTALNLKADKTEIPSVPITAIQKNGTGITPVSGTVNITVPTQASDINAATATQGSKADTAIQGIKVNNSTVNPDANKVVNITVPTSAADVSALPDTTKYAAALSLTINSSTFVMTGQLKDQNGDNLGTAQTIDLPLESVVVGGSYNSQTKKVVLTLQNGNTIEFSVADLVSGLQTELSASNKLNPAYINYDSTHRAVSDTEKSTWNSKQSALTTEQLAAVNSGITSADVAQITTNKNNIIKNKNALTTIINSSGKNNLKLLNDVGYSTTINNVTYKVNSDYTITANGTAQGQSRFDFAQYTGRIGDILSGTTGGSATTYFIYIRGGSSDYCYNDGITIANGDIGTSRTYSIVIADGVQVNNVIFKPMVCSSDLWNISSEYEPYCPTVAELYEMIKALQS